MIININTSPSRPISGHLAGKNGDAFLYAPTDIEGHLGRDRRFYVLGAWPTSPLYNNEPPPRSLCVACKHITTYRLCSHVSPSHAQHPNPPSGLPVPAPAPRVRLRLSQAPVQVRIRLKASTQALNGWAECYGRSLCSDAFMVFGKKSNATDNPEIREATNHLLNTVIPGYVCVNRAHHTGQ